MKGTNDIETRFFLNMTDPAEKHSTYAVQNGQSESSLGEISFHAPWKKYVFEPDAGCIFDASCLKDIIGVMEKLK